MTEHIDRTAFILNSATGASTGIAPLIEHWQESSRTCLIVPPDPSSAHMRARGHDVEDWIVNRRPALLTIEILRAGIRLARILKSRRIVVAHSFGHLANVCTVIAAPLARTPVVLLSVTGLGSGFIGPHRVIQLCLRVFYWLASWMGAQVTCENLADVGCLAFLNRKPSLMIAAGVDVGRSPATSSSSTARELKTILGEDPGPVLLFIGRFIRHKGILELLDAWDRLCDTHPHAHLLLVGQADPGSRYSIDARTIRHVRNAHFLGHREDVSELLSLSDIVVNPSYREGMSRTNMEALAMGKPIVTTNVPGCAETVEDGVNGILVPPFDAAALQVAMDTLIRNDTLRVSMGRAGRVKATKEFSMELISSKMKAIHAKALSRPLRVVRHVPAYTSEMPGSERNP